MTFKKYRISILLIIVLSISAVFGVLHFDNSDKTAVNEKSNKANVSLSKKIPQHIDTEKFYRVKRTIDGDTIELENGERVRYIGIDTPETVDPRKTVQCFSKEASRVNKEMVEGKAVRLEKDISDKDKYGRLLRYVYQGDKFVNLELVSGGYAYAYTHPPDVKNSKLFVEVEREARKVGRGLWGVCLRKNN